MSTNSFSRSGTSKALADELSEEDYEDGLPGKDGLGDSAYPGDTNANFADEGVRNPESEEGSSNCTDAVVCEDYGDSDLPIIRTASKDEFLRSYIALVNKMPYLTDKEEQDLARRASDGDERAVEDLVKSHLRLVVKMALGYYKYGLPAMDLISEGNIGLVTAVRKFDPEKGNRLSTYAMWWIKAMMQSFILKSWSVVKIASTVAERNLFFSLQKIKQKLNIGKESGLSDDEAKTVAEIANIDVKSVKRMDLRLMSGDRSMDSPVDLGDGTVSFGDTIASDVLSPEQELVLRDDRRAFMSSFNRAMSSLSQKEREILLYRISKEMKSGDGASYTLEAIGKKYSISGERVRQIADKAMNKLRVLMIKDGLPS